MSEFERYARLILRGLIWGGVSALAAAALDVDLTGRVLALVVITLLAGPVIASILPVPEAPQRG
jgi:hypothetical protein